MSFYCSWWGGGIFGPACVDGNLRSGRHQKIINLDVLVSIGNIYIFMIVVPFLLLKVGIVSERHRMIARIEAA